MNEQQALAAPGNRIFWLDNLRTFAVFLVVLLHAGLVYESSGLTAFFWIVDDPATNDLSGIVNLVLDIFVMSAIFFVAGFFTPPSLARKTPWAFLRSKFKRLYVPWIIAVLTLIPLYKVIFLYSRGLPQEHWTTYFHWTNGIWNQNWLWFLPVLFLFDVLYVLLSRINIDVSSMTVGSAVGATFALGFLYTLSIDLLGLQGWTKTFLFDFQNERIFIYFMIFLVGALCYRLRTFETAPTNKRLYVVLSCTVWIPICLYLLLVIYPLIQPGAHLFSVTLDRLLFHFSFMVSLLSLLYLTISTFRYYLNGQGTLSRELSRNSYSVYIIHTVVLGGIALVLMSVAIPSLMKHVSLAVLTYSVSSLLVYVYRRATSPMLSSVPAIKYDNA